MKFKIDENLPAELAENLRAAGHDAHTVHEESLNGAADPVVFEHACSDSRILLTLDKGLANVRQYSHQNSPGVVLFRPSSNGRGAVLAFVRGHLRAILALDLGGRLAVVTDRGIRLR